MQIDLSVEGEVELSRYVKNLDKQINYATAVALTKTAQDVQAAEIEHILKTFTVRGAWLRKGGKFGVGVVAARRDNLVAIVESRAPWLSGHEEGETRQPRHQHRYIPTEEIRRTKSAIIAKGDRPGSVYAKGGFVIRTKSGVPLLMIRGARGARGLRLLYELIGSATIKPDLHFVDTAKEIAERVWRPRFDEELARALETAR